jgi:hypothetical protein
MPVRSRRRIFPAVKAGTCGGCQSEYAVGDEVYNARVVMHRKCAPRGLNQIPLAESVERAREKALSALEDVLMVEAKLNGISADMETLFKRLQATKSRALQPGTPAEGVVAMQMALITAVKLAFRGK